MSLSNIQRSLLSSRKFLWSLKDRLSSKDDGSQYKKTPKNFTFDHDQFSQPRKEKKFDSKWFIIIPVATILGISGLIIMTFVMTGLFLLHGVKMLWEGHKTKKPEFRFRKVVLRPTGRNINPLSAVYLKRMYD